jgi:hypothetical protein
MPHRRGPLGIAAVRDRMLRNDAAEFAGAFLPSEWKAPVARAGKSRMPKHSKRRRGPLAYDPFGMG